MVQRITNKVRAIFRQKKLYAFYDNAALERLIQRACAIDYDTIAVKWRIPKVMAYDFAPLILYDVVMYIDDSWSMETREKNGERIEDLKFVLEKVTALMTMFNPDGLSMRFINAEHEFDGISTGEQALDIISRTEFVYDTNFATNLLRKVFGPMIVAKVRTEKLTKPVLVLSLIDNVPEPEPRDTLIRILMESLNACYMSKYDLGALDLGIAQVGTDKAVHAYLKGVQNQPQIQIGGKVNVTYNVEMETMKCKTKGFTLTPELWLLKLVLGPIDPSYDGFD